MAVLVRWRNDEKTILYQRFYGSWTPTDYFQSMDVTYAMLDQVSHPVDIIIDFSGDVASLFRLVSASDRLAAEPANHRVHTNQRMIVVVGGGMLFRKLVEMRQRVVPRLEDNLLCADSLEEAGTLIQQ
jgi:hypothetical protein